LRTACAPCGHSSTSNPPACCTLATSCGCSGLSLFRCTCSIASISPPLSKHDILIVVNWEKQEHTTQKQESVKPRAHHHVSQVSTSHMCIKSRGDIRGCMYEMCSADYQGRLSGSPILRFKVSGFGSADYQGRLSGSPVLRIILKSREAVSHPHILLRAKHCLNSVDEGVRHQHLDVRRIPRRLPVALLIWDSDFRI
jgi:hypothetical protein